jgi:hypothetical protein
VPLWRLFGGASNTIITDITVKILYNLWKIFMMNIILQKKVKALSFRKNKSISQLIIYADPNCFFSWSSWIGF